MSSAGRPVFVDSFDDVPPRLRSAMYSSVYTADITSLTNFWGTALLQRLIATSLMNTYIQNAAISLLTAQSHVSDEHLKKW